MTSDPVSFRAGQSLGRYELLAPIAKGGMGQVWAGRLRGARGFQKLVALKTLLPASEDSERMERMLFEEARIAGLIQHSNVVQTIELGEHEGALYLVMEWVDGEPLSQLIRASEPRGIPLLLAVNLIAQTLRGMQAAHELCDDVGHSLGVVHRDVSPHNVLVSYTGVAKLLDFGIAKAMNQQASSTTTGEIKGKFAYMAPEQILDTEVDQRADLFSVGIMLYLLTSGHHPFKNHDSAGVLHSITSDEPAPRPSLLNAGYSRTLEAVVLKALEKDRDRRWASAAEMRAALQRAVPEAFAIGIEGQLEAFMTELVGERAAQKREALRRAELRSDRSQSGSLPALATAQSASSLRAVSVSTNASEAAEAPKRPSRMPTQRPPEVTAASKRKVRRNWMVAAAGSAALLVGLLLLQRSGAPTDAQTAAAEALPLASQRVHDVAPVAPATSVNLESALPASAGGNANTAATAESPDPRPPHGPRKTPKHNARAVGKSSDLIAPDYAR